MGWGERFMHTYDGLNLEARVQIAEGIRKKWGATYQEALNTIRQTYPLPPVRDSLARCMANGILLLERVRAGIGAALFAGDNPRFYYDVHSEAARRRAREVYLSFYPLSPLEREVISQLSDEGKRKQYH